MTALWYIDELCSITNAQCSDPRHEPVTGVSIDTRTLQKGDVFFALAGEHNDGHIHLLQAAQKGAVAAFIHKSVETDHLPEDFILLKVNDTMEALIALGQAARARFKGRMIAVTGSVGKTTTKNMLLQVLSTYAPTHASVASYNNHIGVPLTLARLPEESHYCICEIGMNHKGEILPLAEQVHPHIGIITTIASAHIGYMGSLEAIAEEKASLFSALFPFHHERAQAISPALGAFIPTYKQFLNKNTDLLLIGRKEDSAADIFPENLLFTEKGSSFTLTLHGQTYPITLKSAGQHLIHSALITLAVLDACRLPFEKGIAALETFIPTGGRGGIHPILNGQALLLDESYNASPLSIKNSLQTLALYKNRRRIVVLGDILELGEFAEEEHKNLAEDVLHHADLVFCAGPLMKHLFEQLPPSLQGNWSESAHTLIPHLEAALKTGDVILVKGSNASKMHVIVSHFLHSPSHGTPA